MLPRSGLSEAVRYKASFCLRASLVLVRMPEGMYALGRVLLAGAPLVMESENRRGYILLCTASVRDGQV